MNEQKQPAIELTVGGGRLRVTAYADDIVRVRYAPDGAFRDKGIATFVDPNAKWDAVDAAAEERGAEWVLETAKLSVRVDKASGTVAFFDRAGAPIAAEGGRTAQPVACDGATYYRVSQRFAAAADEYLYGLGNVDGVVGNRGVAVDVVQSNTEKRTPMWCSNRGYGVLVDIPSNGRLDWDADGAAYRYRGDLTDSVDYYFLYGPAPDAVIAAYRRVTGAAPLPPKNAFGYVQSRNRYASQEELLADMQRFRERHVPVDVTVIDYYWWAESFNDITRWNAADWPDPDAMLRQLHEWHITAAASVWPSFRPGSATYDTVSQKDGFLLPEDTGFGRVYDATSAENRAYYWSLIRKNLFARGMDSIWLDASEPEMGGWTRDGIATAAGDARRFGVLFPLLTNRGVYEGQRALAGNGKRVNTLSRGMVAGTQRYGAQSWSGDVPATWEQLPREVRGALNFAAAGLPYFSTDTGGYFGMDTSLPENRELFLRWLQFSAFLSIMRVHGRDCVKNPWSFGTEYEAYIVKYLALRERLVPYIYSHAARVTRCGGTLVRPLVFDYRTDPNVWTIDDQYGFGDAFLVCPVTRLGQREREVYLPAGTWVDFWTGERRVSRGERVVVQAPLETIPVFVKAGAVVPLAAASEYVDQHPDEGEVRVYMGADGAFTLYEDAGDGYAYEDGAFAETPLVYNDAARVLTIGRRTGTYDGMPESRRLRVVFVCDGEERVSTVVYSGEPLTIAFDAAAAVR